MSSPNSPEKLTAAFVDDTPLFRELVPAVLEGSFDSIEVFEKPEEVIERFARDDRPNILLTDGEMPKMSGFELARIIKDRYPETTIILVSTGIGHANLEDPEFLRTNGIDFFIPKHKIATQAEELVSYIRGSRLQPPKP